MDAPASPASFSADLCACAALPLLAADEVTALFVDAVRLAGGTIVNMVAHTFPTVGVTCVLVLRESHAVIHTWPETATVHLDIFSCTPRLKSVEAIHALGRCLGAGRVSIQEIPRADGHEHRAGA